MTTITIYHNPACGTSRNVLALIRNSGVEPTIIEYLKNPPTTQQIQSWLSAMGATVEEKAPVVMLDAMKMDTYIYASRAGTIAEVCVKVGETVQVGQAIVRYRTEA